MEDDKIKNLFNDFHPELSSSFLFMTQLEKKMEAVEILKQHSAALKRRNRIAVAIAAMTGFVTGIILTLLFPLIGGWMSSFSISLPRLQISTITIEYSFIAWIVMAGVCIISALNAYDIALAKLSSKDSRRL